MKKVNKSNLLSYNEKGVCVVRKVLNKELTRRMKAEFKAIENSSKKLYTTRGGLLPDSFLWIYNELFRQVVFSNELTSLACKFTNSRYVRLFYDQILEKKPNAGKTNWHQDFPYWPLDGKKICTIWIALDHIKSVNGSLEYISGLHNSGKIFRPQKDMWTSLPYESLPNIEKNRGAYEIRSWDMNPGDVLIHNAFIIHGANNNNTNKSRFAYVTRWLGDDVTYLPKEDTMDFPFEITVSEGLELDMPFFPKKPT